MKYLIVVLGEKFRHEYTETIAASSAETARKRAIRKLSRQFPAEREWTTQHIVALDNSYPVKGA